MGRKKLAATARDLIDEEAAVVRTHGRRFALQLPHGREVLLPHTVTRSEQQLRFIARVVAKLGPDGLDSKIYVSRQPGVGGPPDGGGVPLSALHGFHTRHTSGGRQETSYFEYMYAYGMCTELPVGHSGSHGSCPHRILTCVTGAERDDVWEFLCARAGYDPPTEEDVKRERERVKRQVLERLGVDVKYLQPVVGAIGASGPQPPFEDHHWDDVAYTLVWALGRRRRRYVETTWYLDLERGDMARVESDFDDRQEPENPDRYEEIERLEEEELDLLTRRDLEEIAAAFKRSRGFGEDNGR